jgi:Pyruvate/2-oxoacid:ferredoxin oxidoreductase gamma subunit
MKRTESIIQMEIVSLLRRNGFFVFSIPNEAAGKVNSSAGLARVRNLKMMGLLSGASDLVVIDQSGNLTFTEIKAPKGRQSDTQKAFEEVVNTLGFPYVILHSKEEATNFFKLSLD